MSIFNVFFSFVYFRRSQRTQKSGIRQRKCFYFKIKFMSVAVSIRTTLKSMQLKNIHYQNFAGMTIPIAQYCFM